MRAIQGDGVVEILYRSGFLQHVCDEPIWEQLFRPMCHRGQKKQPLY